MHTAPKKRNIKPRPDLPIAARSVSELTIEPVFGVNRRRYNDVIVPRCKGVARIGRLHIAPCAEVERVLAEMAAESDPGATSISPSANDTAALEPQPETGDEVLHRLGLRRTGAC